MAKIAPMIASWFAVALGLLLLSNHAAQGQTVLERLEQQIRQRNGATAPATPAPTPTAANTPHEAAYLGLVANDQQDRGRGVRILSVHSNSPAQKAGLRSQDLITSIADVRVRQMSDAADILASFAPGEITTFEILRAGKKQRITLEFGRRPSGVPPHSADKLPISNRPDVTVPGGALTARPPLPVASAETVPTPPAEALSEPAEQSAGPALVVLQKPAPAAKSATPAPPSPSKADASVMTDAQRITQMQRRIDELEHRVAELEKALAKPHHAP